MTAPITPRGNDLLFLAHVSGDTFSVEDPRGGVSLVDSATLKMLLDQLSKGTNDEHGLGGQALG